MMSAYKNERHPLLITPLIVLLIAALAACSSISAIFPTTSTGPDTIPTLVPTIAIASPAVGMPAAEKKEAGENTLVSTTEIPSAVEDPSALPCAGRPACANLLVTQSGRPARVGWSAQGLQAGPTVKSPTEGTRWVIDTGTPSPDGKWVAYTSLGYETGGPVYVQSLESGEWENLVEQINAHRAEGQPEFPADLYWDVIGWFPDSQRLMIGPGDLSFVIVIDRASYAAQVIGFPGGGKGGRAFATLAPDGGSFLFLGENEAGQQTISSYTLASGQISVGQVIPYEDGFLTNPRFSPDGTKIAYIQQSGQPESGLTYAMNVLVGEGGMFVSRKLVEGNLSMTVPSWSPDGSYIAFTRNDAAPMLTIAANAPPPDPQGNVWVVSVKDGAQAQITQIDGLARSPVWAKDGKTLAFITGDGAVNLTSIDQPGQVWQAAGPSDQPELTSMFFVP